MPLEPRTCSVAIPAAILASLVPQGRRSVWPGGAEVVARALQPLAAELATRGSVAERVGWTSD
eukprot:1749988-Lingulodinium_polyedra.AAC.1